jgi:uncharacterized SAM-binding protein YcdF (DUF218 family)
MIGRNVRSTMTAAGLVLLSAAITVVCVSWRVNDTGGRDEAQKADAIIILGARVEGSGEPGPDLLERTLHAVDLFHEGMAPFLVCTGGYPNERLSAASVARRLAVSEGVPPDAVLRADGSMTTREDAIRARDLMFSRGWRTAILVSHPLHLERARFLFEDQGVDVYTSPTSTRLDMIPWKTRAWLTARETAGILWIALEDLGVPPEWTARLGHLVYGPPTVPDAN